MRSPHRRPLYAALAISLLLPLTVVVAQPPPPPLPPPIPEVLAFASDGQTWAWIHGTANEMRLLHAAPGQPGKELSRGKGWREVAVTGSDCWILTAGGDLLRVPVSGGEPQIVLKGLDNAGGIRGFGSDLWWLQVDQPSGRPFFVPASGPMLRLRHRSAAGVVQTAASWPSGPLPSSRPGAGDIIALSSTEAHVRARRPLSTEFVKLPLPSGEGERLAAETGLQEAVLTAGGLYWTAPSDEAGDRLRMARRRTLDGRIEDVTDWLPGGGTLTAAPSGKVLYSQSSLYELPGHFGPSPIRSKLGWSTRLVSDGTRLVKVSPTGPSVHGETF